MRNRVIASAAFPVLMDHEGIGQCRVATQCCRAGSGKSHGHNIMPLPELHCGIIIDWDGVQTSIDGKGGASQGFDIVTPPDIGPSCTIGEWSTLDSSACDCLLGGANSFNKIDPPIPRDNTEHNSNFTLHCLYNHCGLAMTWNMPSPIGWNCVECTKYETVTIESGCYRLCVEERPCPCTNW